MKKLTIAIVTGVGIIIAAPIVTLLIVHHSPTTTTPAHHAQAIPAGTLFDEVRKLSAGTKPACLSHDSSLDSVAQADDALPFDKSLSMAIGTVIPDMPAGHTTTVLHSYSPTNATGYEVFSSKNQQAFVKGLDSFNFTVSRKDADATWQLDTFIACSRQ